ncbi:MAG: insulinase family protein [Acidobacteria bacterium]|nr:insulinase family protein [Acidobacteriota bacterium]
MKRAAIAIAALLCAPCALAEAPRAGEIPAHPRELKYGELRFNVPDAAKYRFALKSGVVAYVAEDHNLPLVNIDLFVRAGAFLEPAEKTGLAGLTGTMMRKGGAGELNAEQFDERADFLAAQISSSGGATQSSAGLDCISPVLDDALNLFFDMLRRPRFQEDRLAIEKDQIVEAMKQRNDDADSILSREWSWLMYGPEHVAAREQTKKQLEGIGREDLLSFHKSYWRPENIVVAVSGDVDTKKILAELDRRFADWAREAKGPKVAWPPQQAPRPAAPGVYHVEKDIPQGKVSIGHLATQWDKDYANPDNFALMVTNDILGGGGFTSRVTKRIRSDEGLAYSAGSGYSVGNFWPGVFRIFFQTKNATVAYASKISLEEVRRMQQEPVSDKELATSKNSFTETFPRAFDSAAKIAGTFANDEHMGRPHSYWQRYRDSIKAVTAADVQRVAKQYLKPEQLSMLIVGKWAEIEPGDVDGRAKMAEFFGGKVTHLPLRDPLTLEPLN